ncbi:hypothetical protein ABZX88_34485 [Kitasatospora aureofaciens]|uniref:hypothetical protein n=1 Tax=Kitasatospora aureofaciens TaxID=1894 RepID=UPI0033B906D6
MSGGVRRERAIPDATSPLAGGQPALRPRGAGAGLRVGGRGEDAPPAEPDNVDHDVTASGNHDGTKPSHHDTATSGHRGAETAERQDVVPPSRHEAVAPGDHATVAPGGQGIVPPRRRSATTSSGHGAAGPRRRGAAGEAEQRGAKVRRAAPRAAGAVALTVRFDPDEAIEVDASILSLRVEGGLRTVDKAEVVRELLRMVREHPGVRQELLHRLQS